MLKKLLNKIFRAEETNSNTAKKLMERLKKDPEYVCKIKAKNERMKHAHLDFEQKTKPILHELRKGGFKGKELSDLCRYDFQKNKKILPILLKLIESNDDKNVLSSLVRPIQGLKVSYDGRALAEAFDRTDCKSEIAIALSMSRPEKISEWLTSTTQNIEHGNARDFLFIALAKTVKTEETKQILKLNFDDSPGHISSALGYIGGNEEIKFLEGKLESYEGWVANDIKKSIANIRRKLNAKKMNRTKNTCEVH